MEFIEQGCLLRILIGESDRCDGKPLYEWIVLEAKKKKLAGATVFRGMMGFGANSIIHSAKILRLSEDLPILIEIVDPRPKLEAFLKSIKDVMQGGLATLEKADVEYYRSKDRK